MLEPGEEAFNTGWFGVPGDMTGRRSSKIHIVHGPNNKPVCGTVMSDRHIFQWNSRGIYIPYVECKKCRKALEKRFPGDLLKRFD